MPALTNALPHVMYHARKLPETDPVWQSCRARLQAMRARSKWLRELAAELGCSERHARRLIEIYGLKPYGTAPNEAARRAAPGPQHPPARWCSCEWCVKARSAMGR